MRKSFKKEKNHRILWTVLIVVAIVAACAFGFFAAKNGTFSKNKPVPRNMSPVSVKMNFELDPGISYQHAATENKLFFYSSENIKIINDTNVEVVENTKENKITLITCVENEPEKRRCIQGKLII